MWTLFLEIKSFCYYLFSDTMLELKSGVSAVFVSIVVQGPNTYTE